MQRTVVSALLFALAAGAADAAAATCDELGRFAPSGSRITLSATVAPGVFRPPTPANPAAAQAYAALPAF